MTINNIDEFEKAYRKLLANNIDIESVPNCEYLWEIEGMSGTFDENEIIELARQF